ncbi:hypothetical protein CRG98_044716 [Punica granatum]|uniref:Uncharacterized protein n=1 Tax=Punica granatum TaxID=22663 RepID=A0A2I0HTT8_PUNGR|nr:hypothetical protein CRG98_044716 [Punica granatum]
MATKKTMCATFILAVVLMALAASSEAIGCMDDCMPECMQVKDANNDKCREACGGYCDQTEGSSLDRCHAWAC